MKRVITIAALALLPATAGAQQPLETDPRTGAPPPQCLPCTTPPRPAGLLLGAGYRGILAEEGDFQDKLHAEAGVFVRGFGTQLDLAVGVGGMFKANSTPNWDVRARVLLPQSPVYLGGGYVFRGDEERGYGTVGIGKRVFFELNLRESSVRPLAAIFALGIRIPF